MKNYIYLFSLVFIMMSQYLNASGNNEIIGNAEEAWQNGDFPEAQRLYGELSEKDPRMYETALYNQALSLYKQKEFQEAGKLLSQLAIGHSDDFYIKLMMLSGNISYRNSQQFMESGEAIDEALTEIVKGISWYKRILEISPHNVNGSHNLELANLLKEQIRMKNDEKQKEEEKNNEMQEQLKQLKEKQKQLADDSQKGADDHSIEQEKLQDETNQLKNEMSNNDEEFQKQMDNANEMQQKALQDIKQGQYEEAEKSQNEAVQALEKALDTFKSEESDNNEQSEENQMENSDQIAQSIIENENNRESSSNITGDNIIVDRNW